MSEKRPEMLDVDAERERILDELGAAIHDRISCEDAARAARERAEDLLAQLRKLP